MVSINTGPARGYPSEARRAAFGAAVGKTQLMRVLGEHINVHGEFQPQTTADLRLLSHGVEAFLNHPEDFFPRVLAGGEGIVFRPKTEEFRGDVFESHAIGFLINSGNRRNGAADVDPSLEIWLLSRNGDGWVRKAGVELNAGIPLTDDGDHVPVKSLVTASGEYDPEIVFATHPSRHSFATLLGLVKEQIESVVARGAQAKYTIIS